MMVYDHMMYFGDRGLVKTHLPAIDSILHFLMHVWTTGSWQGKQEA